MQGKDLISNSTFLKPAICFMLFFTLLGCDSGDAEDESLCTEYLNQYYADFGIVLESNRLRKGIATSAYIELTTQESASGDSVQIKGSYDTNTSEEEHIFDFTVNLNLMFSCAEGKVDGVSETISIFDSDGDSFAFCEGDVCVTEFHGSVISQSFNHLRSNGAELIWIIERAEPAEITIRGGGKLRLTRFRLQE